MIFLSVFLTLTVLLHFALYRFILRWLGPPHPAAKTALLATLSFLGISFIAAFLLLRWSQNPLTVFYYRLAAVWFALAINLGLAVGTTWLFYLFFRRAGLASSSFRPLATGLVVFALAWSAHGFWTAFHPIVTAVDVRLENLPEQWRGRKIVQLSDVHLGHFHGTAAMERLAQRVDKLQPDLVVITGDLFDGMSDGVSEFEAPLRRLTARHGVFFVTGNHEIYAGLRRCLDVVSRTGIRVLFNEVVEVDGLQLMGVAYPGIRDRAEIRGLDDRDPAASGRRALILLFHTPTDIRTDFALDRRTATYFRPDTSFALARELGVSLQLSGHTHHGQLFPFGLITNWIYNGYDYGRHREGGFTLYTSSGVGTWGPPMRTGASPEIVAITLR
jgi:predicted MPP superfamily phosphohydrolase